MDQKQLKKILKKWNGNTKLKTIDFETLLLQVAHEVARLLIEDPNRLKTALYQLDVSETLVGEVLRTSLDRDVPLKIADLIVRREIQRLKKRVL
jgi:hypothetical protein